MANQPGISRGPNLSKPLRSGKADIEHGRLKMKVFQVVESDLDDLGRMNRDTALLTAAATGFGGFALDVTKDLLLSGGAPATTIAFFAGVSAVSWIVAGMAGVAAWRKWSERGAKLREIKSRMEFFSDGDG